MSLAKERMINRWKLLDQPKIDDLQCYICDYKSYISNFKIFKSQDIFNAGEIIRYQCPNCDVIFGDLRFLKLSKEQINDDYTDLYSYYKEADTTKYILEVFDRLNLFIPDNKNKKILDFACGNWNSIIPIIKSKGFNYVYGYDKYVNSDLSYMIDEKQLLNDKFDIIYSNNFIEHLIDPINDIKYLLNCLQKNGCLIFITSCFEYCYEFTHFHTFFFIGRSIDKLCKKLNIKMVYSTKIIFKDGVFTTVKIFKKCDL
jgi:SAM-dependent methyltransferase